MGRLFGTDGVRGRANAGLTAELALDLSVAAAHVLGEVSAVDHAERTALARPRPVALVGRDPRASGEFLEAAVVSGLASAGVDVVRLGVVPTPGVAWLVGHLRADLGVMISASHNPMPDNGIKFFARGGTKLADSMEDLIEARMEEAWQRPTGASVGRVVDDPQPVEDYLAHLVTSLGRDQSDVVSLSGLKVVIDGANGAAYRTGPGAFQVQGAEVVAIHCEPDGLNINDGCGSTHLGDLQAAVREHGADLGIAVDGDADRCLCVDADGEVVDGDQILAVLAVAMKEAGTLSNDTVVATVMSNLGFLTAMREHGIHVVQSKVGDRYVLEDMRAGGHVLGGEQSGHVVQTRFATTGDGVLTGLHLAARMASTGRSLAELASIVQRMPQVLVNVPVLDKARAENDPPLLEAVTQEQTRLGERGRILLRPSGTEDLVRVMVEAETEEIAAGVAHRLADVVRARLGR
ncbi:MAG TPA: phosphoglucosamine mutase [Candidatus Avipropionibacterium avicola]|uniref:Phosphoglucosamine mutase n=1 Tax=Candidatus Avipropionibacterium avicola TaxID=2840701 RepID=A0A9D1KMC6_9ACTN|nr:phosphoglucosamine mutase [Candidatus Avipropionibacterium avicola]